MSVISRRSYQYVKPQGRIYTAIFYLVKHRLRLYSVGIGQQRHKTLMNTNEYRADDHDMLANTLAFACQI